MSTTSWRKSSRSSGNNNSDCVEARRQDGTFQVRDSKLGESSPIFDLGAAEFKSLLGGAARV
ncbi:DUF397 domain-containing protein [Glycomyces paridis]|uniref:DUF397 domain-containing protein n=1 Tax=Glycomyces paridis TaxID=2126555 RepID=A0A4S8PEB0_9ACTN|nr:DUF397 domain-containing protein [Glycomyces paridis]THV27955.1 DUF397 domain-containing protein [Glycomyces paridis]